MANKKEPVEVKLEDIPKELTPSDVEEKLPSRPVVIPEFKPHIESDEIGIFESLVIRYKDVAITITGAPGGELEGKVGESLIAYCADILRGSVGEGSVEETIDIHESIRETLMVNYGWNNLEYNEFVKIWRRNLYLKKIGNNNNVEVDLEEYNKFLEYLEKKKKNEIGDIEIGSESLSDAEVLSQEVEKPK